MKKTTNILCLIASLFLSQMAIAGDIVVKQAWIRAMPSSSKVVPIYLTMQNNANKSIALKAIATSAGKVELHKMVMNDGMMKMLPVKQILIKAKSVTKLAPGGFHGMLMNFTSGVPKFGQDIPLTLTFTNGDTQNVVAHVQKI
ncbi:copper chaperone PCu(A)C [Parashewanella curva]|uniref:Copper chaperone PCu(A)C n=1 Tax=Parashewanella curva TaxID=2338552 RepID=A0A3L8PXR1_9GAMM|nr:copper chaperone PCu(A)C [Parashewanella curva]RLV59238.1 copper chaperone PCu(A)C [Parashewanella curva]